MARLASGGLSGGRLAGSSVWIPPSVCVSAPHLFAPLIYTAAGAPSGALPSLFGANTSVQFVLTVTNAYPKDIVVEVEVEVANGYLLFGQLGTLTNTQVINRNVPPRCTKSFSIDMVIAPTVATNANLIERVFYRRTAFRFFNLPNMRKCTPPNDAVFVHIQ